MDRGKQVLRQWKLLRLLERTHSGLTVAELCQSVKAGVERTIYRDLEQLEEAGFPLERLGGRWRLYPEALKQSSIPLSHTHLLALQVVSGWLQPLKGTWLADPIDELQERLSLLLPPHARGFCEALRRHVSSTFAVPLTAGLSLERVAAPVEEALVKEHRVRIRYVSASGTFSERTLDPYATWYVDGRPYLIGYCHRAAAMRTFALQRIQSIEVLDETFDRDPGFDLEDYTETGIGAFHDEPRRVVLIFDREVAFIPKERTLHSSQSLSVADDGSVEVTMTVGGMPELAALVVSYGGLVTVVEPPELVERVIQMYRGGLEAQLNASTPRVSDLRPEDFEGK